MEMGKRSLKELNLKRVNLQFPILVEETPEKKASPNPQGLWVGLHAHCRLHRREISSSEGLIWGTASPQTGIPYHNRTQNKDA